MRGIVFGTSLDSARNKLNKIRAGYEILWKIETERIISSRYEYTMIFSNGDIWCCSEMNGSGCHGKRCNVAIIDRGIPKEIIDCVILPCVVKDPYGAVDYY